MVSNRYLIMWEQEDRSHHQLSSTSIKHPKFRGHNNKERIEIINHYYYIYIYIWLVVWNIFFRGVGQPPKRYIYIYICARMICGEADPSGFHNPYTVLPIIRLVSLFDSPIPSNSNQMQWSSTWTGKAIKSELDPVRVYVQTIEVVTFPT